jgi:hypothetical protein
LAGIVGDAAHAFVPLTAKMANLAINDAFTLGKMLNDNSSSLLHEQGTMKNVLEDWEAVQRLKFNVTRTRTLRHLQLYSPQFRGLTGFLWKLFPTSMLQYFGSIFAYDYEVYNLAKAKTSAAAGNNNKGNGIVGNASDPLITMIQMKIEVFLFLFVLSAFLIVVFTNPMNSILLGIRFFVIMAIGKVKEIQYSNIADFGMLQPFKKKSLKISKKE